MCMRLPRPDRCCQGRECGITGTQELQGDLVTRCARPLEHLSHPDEAASDMRLDGAEGEAGGLRDLLVGETAVYRKAEHTLLLGAERGQGTGGAVSIVEGLDRLFGPLSG